MSAVWLPLVAAPPLAFASLAYAMRPATAATGPTRLAVVRAALAVGSFAVLDVEVLGALDALHPLGIGLSWLAALAVALVAAGWRRRRDGTDGGVASVVAAGIAAVVARWRALGRWERVAIGVPGALVLAELLVALLAEPNNFDSQTYHLPKIEHWVAQGDLGFWATSIHRQVALSPGCEYLLLHLRLLTDGDRLYNLVQWAAGIGCMVVASRITAQLGGGRRAQLIAVFVLGATPMVVSQATSTQTDLTVAAWAGCAATLALDGWHRRTGAGSVLALGAASGLTMLTKSSGMLGVAPMLVLWGVAQLRQATSARALAHTIGASIAILLTTAAFVGPFTMRVMADFDHPMGPPRLRNSIPMGRHDPGSIVVNALRIGHTALDTPIAPLRAASADAIVAFADLIGVDPWDPETTFVGTRFPVQAWYPDEDRVAFPVTGWLALLGTVVALVRPRSGRHRAYAVATTTSVLLYVATIKWQPWGNRLLVFALVLSVPLAAMWLEPLTRPRARPNPSVATRRGVMAGLAMTVFATSAVAGILTVGYGYPRRLVGAGSVFTTGELDTRFMRRAEWTEQYRWAAERVNASGARRIGLVQRYDDWEYPWWLLLNSDDIVALQSATPKRAPADPATVDAIVCTGDRDACNGLKPEGWQLRWSGYVGYALSPRIDPDKRNR